MPVTVPVVLGGAALPPLRPYGEKLGPRVGVKEQRGDRTGGLAGCLETELTPTEWVSTYGGTAGWNSL